MNTALFLLLLAAADGGASTVTLGNVTGSFTGTSATGSASGVTSRTLGAVTGTAAGTSASGSAAGITTATLGAVTGTAIGVSSGGSTSGASNSQLGTINGSFSAATALGGSTGTSSAVLGGVGGGFAGTIAPLPSFTPSALRTRLADAAGGLIAKTAESVLDYPVIHALEPGETIEGSSWSVSPDDPGALTIVNGSDGTAAATAWCLVGGGLPGRVYSLTNRVTTSAGRVLDAVMTFRILPGEPA